jgi:catalase
VHFAQPNDEGDKGRIRPESFADHYSQARMFFRSQSSLEQAHMASALVFELSKVETPHVRLAVLAQLRNVDESLATRVAAGLGLTKLPDAATPAMEVREEPESPALRIIDRMKPTLRGRWHTGIRRQRPQGSRDAAEGGTVGWSRREAGRTET